MTCVCESEVIACKREPSVTSVGVSPRVLRTVCVVSGEVPYIDGRSMLRWTPLLKVFLQDQEKELTALKALGELMMHMQHPEGASLSALVIAKCIFRVTSLPRCLISVLALSQACWR